MGESRSESSAKIGGFELVKESIIEAKDNYGTWYPAKVLAVVDDKVHVHFCNWSSRYDTWYPINSGKIRPLKRLNTATKMTKSQPVDLKPRIPSSTKQFDLNTYVMASWKNNYEYLAEVIAHRHRQGGRSEYKLRYVWDRVVEWTPAVRLRKATQFEIDYVLKFCREHGGGTTKISSTQRSPSSQSASVASPCARKGTDPVRELSSSTTRSQSKTKEPPDRQTQANCQVDREPPTLTTTATNGPVGETKVNSPPLFDKIEHDGMVYDRSVAQFHEACRKRRELKRQAIELEGNNQQMESRLTGKNGSFNGGKRFASSSTPTHTLSKQNDCSTASDDAIERPSKAPRLDESKDLALVSCKPLTTLTKSESPLLPVACTSPTKPISVNHGTTKPKHSKMAISPKRPLTAPSLTTSASRSVKPDPEKIAKLKQAPSPTSRVSSSVPSKSSPPVTYPCPYCPRQLRHSKLLTAHISNYHKDIRPPNKSRLPVRGRTQSITKQSDPTNSSERTARPHPGTEKPGRVPSGASQNPPNFTRLVTCHRCDTRTYATDKETGLVQCQCCLCWMHRTCYNLTKSANNPVELLCDGCTFADRSARCSRLYESYTQWMRTGKFPWDCSSVASSTDQTDPLCQLVAKTSAFVNWTHHLRPLLRSGWSVLDKTKLSVTPFPVGPSKINVVPPQAPVLPLPPPAPLPPLSANSLIISKSDRALSSVLNSEGVPLSSVDCSRGLLGGTKTNDFSGQDPSVSSEDQVNRLYMELRGLAFEPSEPVNSEAAHSRSALSNPMVAEDPAFSPLESVCAPACWTLVGEDINYCADVSNTDSNEVTSSQVLSGFLQDLGPNVMPELTDLGSDPMGSDADVDYFFKPQLIDPRSDSHPGLTQPRTPPISSASDTPTKGLGTLLSSPNAVATVLQASLGHAAFLSTNGFDVSTAVKENPRKEAEKKWRSREKHNSTSVLGEPISECVKRPRNAASAPPMITDLVTASLIDDVPASHLFGPPNQLTASPNKLILGPETSLTPVPDSLKSATISSTPVLHPADVDWISANATSQTIPMPSVTSLPCILSRSDSITKEISLGDPNAASVYDEFGIYSQHQQVPDAIFPDDFVERLSIANQGLDDLDERILTPLESILAVMESRMDELDAELALLEQQQLHGVVVGRTQSQSVSTCHDADEQIEQDDDYSEGLIMDSDGMTTDNHLDADTMLTSPLCSSSSSVFSLSPHQNHTDEPRVVSSDFLQESPSCKPLVQSPSVCRHSYLLEDDAAATAATRAKRAARKLYQFSQARLPVRSWHPPDLLGMMHSSTRPKTAASCLFPTRNKNLPSRM